MTTVAAPSTDPTGLVEGALAQVLDADPAWVFGIPFTSGMTIGGTTSDRPCWRRVLRRDRFCPYCGQRLRWRRTSVDHVEARAAGGARSPVLNGICACKSCNREKSDTALLLYLLGCGRPPRQPLR